MLTKRIIPCLDVKDGRVVKGINFVDLADAGNPVELAQKYNDEGADELVFLDITASYEKRRTMIKVVKKVAEKVFIPLCVGGGIKTLEDIRNLLAAGADKISINTEAVKNPQLIQDAAKKFGSQCVVVAIDAKRVRNSWEILIKGGREQTGLDALEWAKRVEKLGAGEILLTSMDRDGTKKGFDLELTRKVVESVNIPVIASGGVGSLEDIKDGFIEGKADAALAASIFHYTKYSIVEVKKYLEKMQYRGTTMIIPSIDIMDKKAVQLKQGKEKVLEREDVLALAEDFKKYGDIAVIDLDAALGKGDNLELIKKICKLADCRVGGGIRTIEKANKILQAGAKKIIIGTNATPEFLKELPKERVIVAVDTKNNTVVKEGWQRETNNTPEQIIKNVEDYCSEFLFTNVDKEGLMQGSDFEKVKELLTTTKNKLTVAGGISSVEEIKLFENLGVNVQLGMAIYTNKITLPDAFISVLDFKKNNNLIPTIVQDDKKQVLMMAYSTKESLTKAFSTGKATYYSRSRKKIWMKGESSGNIQQLVKVRYDCDQDTLLFTVKQRNVACHLGAYSCFGDKEFSLQELFEILSKRVSNPLDQSYTSKIAKNEKQIMEKIAEESQELVDYKDKNNLIWEAADLLYFIMVLLAKNGVMLSDVKNELWRRRK